MIPSELPPNGLELSGPAKGRSMIAPGRLIRQPLQRLFGDTISMCFYIRRYLLAVHFTGPVRIHRDGQEYHRAITH